MAVCFKKPIDKSFAKVCHQLCQKSFEDQLEHASHHALVKATKNLVIKVRKVKACRMLAVCFKKPIDKSFAKSMSSIVSKVF